MKIPHTQNHLKKLKLDSGSEFWNGSGELESKDNKRPPLRWGRVGEKEEMAKSEDVRFESYNDYFSVYLFASHSLFNLSI